MSLGYSGSFTADGPGEFWCDTCGARCIRNRSDGTEYEHLIGFPHRPDEFTKGTTCGSRVYRGPTEDTNEVEIA